MLALGQSSVLNVTVKKIIIIKIVLPVPDGAEVMPLTVLGHGIPGKAVTEIYFGISDFYSSR